MISFTKYLCPAAFILLNLMSYTVVAETDAAASIVKNDPIAMSNLIELTLGMLVVLGLIMFLAWIAKRSGKFQLGAGGALKIMGGLSFGGKERVVLLQVGKEQLLIGVTQGSVRTLHVLDTLIQEADSMTTKTQGFSEQIAKFMNKEKTS